MKKIFNRLFLTLLSVSALLACSKPDDVSTQKRSDPLEIMITPEIQKQTKSELVKYQDIGETLIVHGRIETQNLRSTKVNSPITGRVSDLFVNLGDVVKKGQILAKINSVELIQMQLALIKSTQLIELKTKAIERAKLLFEADVISQAEMLRIKNELDAVQADYKASRSQLIVLGMNEKALEKLEASGQINSSRDIVSQFDGIIIFLSISLGQIVNPQDNLFHIADLSKLWAVADIPEQQSTFIQKEDSVIIEIPALENKKIDAKVIFKGSIVDSETRTVMVRAEMDNQDYSLKPNMLISMFIQSKKLSSLAVPVSSVVRENDQDYIFVQNTSETYRLREVKLGHKDGNLITVLSGIAEGETIISAGAFHLNSDRKKQELE